MSIIGNIGGQSGGGSLTKSILIVKAPTGSAVAIKKGSVTKTAAEKNGEWWFKNLENGAWTITATLGGQSATESFNITQFGVYRKSITYRLTPEFTYSGSYQVVQDNDSVISDFANWKGNWKIRFLTSGTLIFTNLHGFGGVIDLFLVGGGGAGGQWCNGGIDGAGGGGGYTVTNRSIRITTGTKYNITVGAGGTSRTGENASGNSGGITTALGVSANGGAGGEGYGAKNKGGNGGSGGGGGCYDGKPGGNGGSDGSNGIRPSEVTSSERSHGGSGQGRTTREFENPSGKLYAGGGAGAWNALGGAGGGGNSGKNGDPNTGGGGGGGYSGSGITTANGGTGGSGIAIIRNAR